MHIDPHAYLQTLKEEIRDRQERGIHSIYKISEKMRPNVALIIQKYFSALPGYRVEIKKCKACTHTYDIIIEFPLE